MQHLFDPNTWNYGLSLPQIVQAIPPPLRKALGGKRKILQQVQQGGGKALGLSICELVAQSDARLRVPPWMMLSRAEQKELLFFEKFPAKHQTLFVPGDPIILRSSHIEEDWMDGDAGTYLSLKSKAFEWRDALERLYGKNIPLVIQKLEPGVGIIVDIGWSQLMHRAVVRIAIGRVCKTPEGIGYTSATFDRDGEIQVRDPETGLLLLPRYKGVELLPTLVDFPFHDFACTLYRAVQKTDIKFGVQLEMVIHPDRPQDWHLVQIRPAPRVVRGTFTPPETKSIPIAWTPVVNTVCVAEGKPVLLMRQQDPLWKWSFRRAWFGQEIDVRDPELLKRVQNSIVLWSVDVQPDVGIKQVEAMSALGALGHISRSRLMINTTHSTFRDRDCFENPAVGGILEIRTDNFDQICGLCQTMKNPRITIVSDGLIGHVYVESQDA
ncbi:TPA: hypothetical protein DEP34_01415 [Candidatus Uhrbacteria bacterium]|uniref:Uncharacterized protein n=2 Tax=Candidatus Uhriibacteriota TaxID=1752732 RepID=A0A0G1Q7L1_9BACT|nr:MAG: hypothetical protein UX45_C0004G0038 [Candidatus Uhrbacteria bacterium GW2011_GWF2_46_218]KKU41046.1 MAG: hypothetical protein UX57_C0007G0078 [Candidatus Uhrbacteria bacterium GW2011_GWE2_46_68]HBK33732.1 hypothetical protein [Candidatus Uhrbacteria bacterium]HCB19027.1 hypothetical protein [Candidatus Uhrbacteria bacterium]